MGSRTRALAVQRGRSFGGSVVGMATRSKTFTQIVGALALPTTNRFFAQLNTLEAARLANVPSERTATYYLDNTLVPGAGSPFPTPTLAEVQTFLTSLGTTGKARLRFRCGTTWREDTLLLVLSNVTIDSYGAGNKPVFTRFVYQYAAGGGGWTADTSASASGNAYYRTENNSIAWVKFATGADALGRPLTQATSVANCKATNDSFYMDTTAHRLYVRLGANTDPNASDLESCIGSVVSDYHIDLYGDNIRFQGIRLEGYGMRPNGSSNSVYGIAARPQSATDEIVIQDCEIYYTGYHAVGHLGSPTSGFVTVKDVTAGLCRLRSDNGCIVFVTYSDSGGNETIFRGLTVHSGNLWEGGAQRSAQGVYGHTASGTNNLCVARDVTHTAGAWSCLTASGFNNVATASASTNDTTNATEMAKCRAFIINEYINEPTRTIDVTGAPGNQFQTRCFYAGQSWAHNSRTALGNSGAGWMQNSYVRCYHDVGAGSMFAPLTNGGRFTNVHLDYRDAGCIFGMNEDAVGWANMVVENSILSGTYYYTVTPGLYLTSTAINLSIAAANVTYCGLHQVMPTVDSVQCVPDGTAGDGTIPTTAQHNVTIAPFPAAWPVALAVPGSGSNLYDAGNASTPEYDYAGNARGSLKTIGPVSGA